MIYWKIGGVTRPERTCLFSVAKKCDQVSKKEEGNWVRKPSIDSLESKMIGND